jgi:hypothetical protein
MLFLGVQPLCRRGGRSPLRGLGAQRPPAKGTFGTSPHVPRGPLRTMSVPRGTLRTSPSSRTRLSRRTLRVRAGRYAPAAREAGLTRCHASQGEDNQQHHRWIEAQAESAGSAGSRARLTVVTRRYGYRCRATSWSAQCGGLEDAGRIFSHIAAALRAMGQD